MFSSKKLLYCYIVILLFSLFFVSIHIVFAQDTILPGGVKQPCGKCNELKTENDIQQCKQYCGDYELNDFARIAVNISTIILGVSGSLALLAFVYGGVMFLISAGNNERVEKAKRIIFGAVVGLIIVFASYAIINFIMDSLGYAWSPWNTVR